MKIYSLLFALLFFACAADEITTPTPDPDADPEPIAMSDQPGILLIIVDDFGLDASPGYSIGAAKPTMPVLDSLQSLSLIHI